jgi:hypothetical protein
MLALFLAEIVQDGFVKAQMLRYYLIEDKRLKFEVC